MLREAIEAKKKKQIFELPREEKEEEKEKGTIEKKEKSKNGTKKKWKIEKERQKMKNMENEAKGLEFACAEETVGKDLQVMADVVEILISLHNEQESKLVFSVLAWTARAAGRRLGA